MPAESADAVGVADARHAVKQGKNSAVNPVVATEEVAEELGISVDRAFELLQADAEVGYVTSKTINGDDPADHAGGKRRLRTS